MRRDLKCCGSLTVRRYPQAPVVSVSFRKLFEYSVYIRNEFECILGVGAVFKTQAVANSLEELVATAVDILV